MKTMIDVSRETVTKVVDLPVIVVTLTPKEAAVIASIIGGIGGPDYGVRSTLLTEMWQALKDFSVSHGAQSPVGLPSGTALIMKKDTY